VAPVAPPVDPPNMIQQDEMCTVDWTVGEAWIKDSVGECCRNVEAADGSLRCAAWYAKV
jgi:hypothetical protein